MKGFNQILRIKSVHSQHRPSRFNDQLFLSETVFFVVAVFSVHIALFC